jgi:hypothetical protein
MPAIAVTAAEVLSKVLREIVIRLPPDRALFLLLLGQKPMPRINIFRCNVKPPVSVIINRRNDGREILTSPALVGGPCRAPKTDAFETSHYGDAAFCAIK